MVGAVAAGASVVGAVGSVIGSSNAANAQQSAAQSANNTQLQMFNQTQQNLSPYMNTGAAANNALLQLTGLGSPAKTTTTTNNPNTAGAGGGSYPTGYNSNGQYQNNASGTTTQDISIPNSNTGIAQTFPAGTPLSQIYAVNPDFANSFFSQNPSYTSGASNGSYSSPSNSGTTTTTSSDYSNALNSPLLQAPSQNLSEAALQATPGYQFNLTQGLKSVNNSAAARGLGNSGAALKGAANYATGLADSTYQNQFNNAVTNQTNQFNRLQSIAASGQNAAAGLGGIASSTANSIGSNTIGAGNAAAGASIFQGNAIGNAANGAAGGYAYQQFMNQLNQPQEGGNPVINDPADTFYSATY